MPPYTVSADLKTRIPVLHAHGYGIQKICHTRRHRGCNWFLSSADLQFILNLLQSKPTIYLDEFQNELLRQLGCQISIPSLFRTLQCLNFSRK